MQKNLTFFCKQDYFCFKQKHQTNMQIHHQKANKSTSVKVLQLTDKMLIQNIDSIHIGCRSCLFSPAYCVRYWIVRTRDHLHERDARAHIRIRIQPFAGDCCRCYSVRMCMCMNAFITLGFFIFLSSEQQQQQQNNQKRESFCEFIKPVQFGYRWATRCFLHVCAHARWSVGKCDVIICERSHAVSPHNAAKL